MNAHTDSVVAQISRSDGGSSSETCARACGDGFLLLAAAQKTAKIKQAWWVASVARGAFIIITTTF